MPVDYYQNILYPLQDKVLKIVGQLPVKFYLTGGTALSRAYLHHRYSDDLDFFVNDAVDFKMQVSEVISSLTGTGFSLETASLDEGFARIFVFEEKYSLKVDFVNDIPFYRGNPVNTSTFVRTDNLLNILSNKITALSRYAPKDVVDIVFICEVIPFNWEEVFKDASEKDLWVNPINAAEILEQFPAEKLREIIWIDEVPSNDWFLSRINQIISDILEGKANSLYAGI